MLVLSNIVNWYPILIIGKKKVKILKREVKELKTQILSRQL